ncbi:hypothetical protein LWI29_035569 [Acer saccharum]|uniref:Uncharacterized protein n=1 Tax=Acer saccharum TaxID=4024 RepID=A0AA39SW50_ACESA|nr:hypothetical protein LWI29_035569 [Acer saccharum]
MIRRIHVPWRAGPADQHPLARSAARLRAGLGPHRVLRGPDLIRPSFLGRPYGPALLGLIAASSSKTLTFEASNKMDIDSFCGSTPDQFADNQLLNDLLVADSYENQPVDNHDHVVVVIDNHDHQQQKQQKQQFYLAGDIKLLLATGEK